MYGLGVIVNGLVIVGASFAALILKKFIMKFDKNNKVEKEIILNKDLHLSSSSYYENWYLKVFLIIMCFFGVYGAIFSFITSFDLEVSNLTLSVFIILLITIFSLTFSMKKRRNAILLGINIIYIILYFLFVFNSRRWT